jgi:hypothetical protein
VYIAKRDIEKDKAEAENITPKVAKEKKEKFIFESSKVLSDEFKKFRFVNGEIVPAPAPSPVTIQSANNDINSDSYRIHDITNINPMDVQ